MRITLTLSEGSLPGLGPALERAGLEVRRRPLLRFVERPVHLIGAALLSRSYRGIVVTSPRGAKVLARGFGMLSSIERDQLPTIWTAGAATRDQLPFGLDVRVPPNGSGAAPLAEAMISAGVSGPVLYFAGSQRRDELPDRLRSAGIEVTEVTGYEVELAGISEVREALQDTDLVLIASHRVLQLAAQMVGRPGLVCLGPATAGTAREAGWTPRAVAERPTVDSVVEAIQSLFFAVPGPQSSPSNPSSGR